MRESIARILLAFLVALILLAAFGCTAPKVYQIPPGQVLQAAEPFTFVPWLIDPVTHAKVKAPGPVQEPAGYYVAPPPATRPSPK